jgi:signal peptidase I
MVMETKNELVVMGQAHMEQEEACELLGTYFYHGSSMTPFFREGDVMEIEPCAEEDIRRGDVLIFNEPKAGRTVVHRVVTAGPEGIATKGDANGTPDPYLLAGPHIRGRVVRVRRGRRCFRVHGAGRGMLQARRAGLVLSAKNLLFLLFCPLYAFLTQRTQLPGWLFRLLRPRLLSFTRPEGIELKLVLGRCVVATRPAGKDVWMMRRRYRILADEKRLPAYCSGRTPQAT